jgi:transposase-like protein
MNTCKCHRFPPEIISYPVWRYYRFNLSHRDIEDLLAERGMRKLTSVEQAQRFLGGPAQPIVKGVVERVRWVWEMLALHIRGIFEGGDNVI